MRISSSETLAHATNRLVPSLIATGRTSLSTRDVESSVQAPSRDTLYSLLRSDTPTIPFVTDVDESAVSITGTIDSSRISMRVFAESYVCTVSQFTPLGQSRTDIWPLRSTTIFA